MLLGGEQGAVPGGGPVSQVEGFRVESKGSYEPVTENLYQWIPWEVQRDGTTG